MDLSMKLKTVATLEAVHGNCLGVGNRAAIANGVFQIQEGRCFLYLHVLMPLLFSQKVLGA